MTEDWKMNFGELNILLAYTDDIVLMGNSRKEVIQIIQKLPKSNEWMGLEANQQKIKYMYIS